MSRVGAKAAVAREKPRLSSRAIDALMAMHGGVTDAKRMPAEGRSELFRQNLCCYNEGWKLTRPGKEIARHLTGRL